MVLDPPGCELHALQGYRFAFAFPIRRGLCLTGLILFGTLTLFALRVPGGLSTASGSFGYLQAAGPAAPPAARTEHAVIDRVEDGAFAVLLIGLHEEERVVAAGELPLGARPGDWLMIRRDLGEDAPDRFSYELDPDKTAAAKARTSHKLRLLKSRGCSATCPLGPAGEALRASP